MTFGGVAVAIVATSIGLFFGASLPQGRQSERELVLIDMKGDGLCLVPPESGVSVLLQRGGSKTKVAWTCPGSDDAFLVLDQNVNGRVDSLQEIVGGGLGPPNGFDFLAFYDGRSTMESTSSTSSKESGKDLRSTLWTGFSLV